MQCYMVVLVIIALECGVAFSKAAGAQLLPARYAHPAELELMCSKSKGKTDAAKLSYNKSKDLCKPASSLKWSPRLWETFCRPLSRVFHASNSFLS